MSFEGEGAEVLKEVRVARICDGLGFGEGPISYSDRLDIDQSTRARVEALITSPDILVVVEADDDGCGDGREVGVIHEGQKIRERSLHRAKVFGGGATMAAASDIGLGRARNMSLHSVFDTAKGTIFDAGLSYGAHTGSHADDEQSGCGAVDKAPVIIAITEQYHQQIAGTIAALGVDTAGLEGIFENYKQFGRDIQGQEYRGAEVVNDIKRDGRVVKELNGEHLEMYIVLNNVEGKTVNQQKVRESSDGKVQVFGIDLWRLMQLSQKLYPEDRGFSDSDRHVAFLSELVYTLSTAATLTKGDLPVYMVSPENELVAV